MKAVQNRVLGRKITVLSQNCEIEKLNLETYPPIETIFQRHDRERRRLRSLTSLDTLTITSKGLGDDTSLIANSEIASDETVTYRGLIITDKHFNVIYGHESVRKAIYMNEDSVTAYVYQEDINDREIMSISVRYAAKEGRLSTMARMESILVLIDRFGIPTSIIQRLLNPPRAKDSFISESEIKKEYYVGKVYEEFSGVKIGPTEMEISVEAFSRIKMMVGNRKIFRDMWDSQETKTNVVMSAVVATERGLPRFEADLRKIVSHEDTYHTFKTGSFGQAVSELKTKYPEESKDSHPHYDLIAATKKLRDLTIQNSLIAFAKNGSSPTERALEDLVVQWINIHPSIHKKLLKRICNHAPELYLETGFHERPDLIEGIMDDIQDKVALLAERVKKV